VVHMGRAWQLKTAVVKDWCGAGGKGGQLKTAVVIDWCGAGRAGQLVTADNKGLVWYTWEGRGS
jgi:hypothetical protein